MKIQQVGYVRNGIYFTDSKKVKGQAAGAENRERSLTSIHLIQTCGFVCYPDPVQID